MNKSKHLLPLVGQEHAKLLLFGGDLVSHGIREENYKVVIWERSSVL